MEPPTITPATTVGYSSYVEPNSTIPRLARVGDSHIPGISNNDPKTAGGGAGQQSAIASTRRQKEGVEREASAVRVRTDPTAPSGPRESADYIKPTVARGLRGQSQSDQIYKKEDIQTRSLHGSGTSGGRADGNGIQIRPKIGGRQKAMASTNAKRSSSNTVGGVEIREEEIMIGVRYHTKRV